MDTPDASKPRRRKLSAIMMVDVSGFSRMMGRDEERTFVLIRDFHGRVEETVQRFEGRVVSTAGDSVFGEFDSVHNAMGCAQAIQEAESKVNAARPPEERIAARIGVHLGDVIVEDYQVYGDGVNIAARLEPIADPGGICISEAVYQQIRNRLTLPVQDLGLQELKNIEHPIRIYKIAPPGDAAPLPATSTAPLAGALSPSAASLAPPAAAMPGSGTMVLGILGVFLLLSPFLLFPTAGVLPTAGAVILSLAAGGHWSRTSEQSGRRLLALGLAIASGALWTNWSGITNTLFVMVGLIVAAIGWGKGRGR